MMMVIFQNKIIYMPSMPPFSRSEKVEDYASQWRPVIWTEHSIRSLDGTKISLLEGTIPRKQGQADIRKHIVVAYFQGNASSLPPRLPYLSSILKLVDKQDTGVQYTLVCLSYRGFWKSSGRASQQGIELDAQALLDWVFARYGNHTDVEFVLWGQSIGAGVASIAAARQMESTRQDRSSSSQNNRNDHRIAGLLLETPFTSLRAMLVALYPQKFLPYRYLGPFLMSTWDSETAFASIGVSLQERYQTANSQTNTIRQDAFRVLFLEAGDDELVPKGDAEKLLSACRGFREIEAAHKVVKGALHTDVMTKGEGKKEIVRFLKRFEHTTVAGKPGGSRELNLRA